MFKNAILIYNPHSGNQGIQMEFDYIITKFIKHGILLHLFPIVENANEMFATMMKEKKFLYDFVILSGGDGTLNRFISLMLKYNINKPVGIIPSGTCNDLARCLRIPQELDKCLDIILTGHTRRIDVGRYNNGDRIFLDTCAGGLFVDVSIKTPSVYKKNFGPLAYYIHGLSELGNIKPYELTIQTDEILIKENILLFLIINGNHAAGMSHLINNADMSDGMMNMILIKECSYMDLANLLFKLLSKDLISDPHVLHIPFKSCCITGHTDLCVSIDGEDGDHLPIHIEVLNKMLEVFVK